MEPKVFYPFLKKLIPMAITALIVLWLYKYYGALEYTLNNMSEFIRLTWEHLFLVVISLAAATTVGVSLGIIMTRKGFEAFGPAIMTLVNIWQSVPSLGVIALAYGILPVFGLSGIGAVPALIALFFHAVAPIVRNTYAGIQSVSKDIIEAANGMGMTPRQILFKIELPNALPIIMGGIRTSTAIIVGTAPLAFLIGGGGLGFWIFTGIALMDMGIMMAGAVPVALIAMAFDFLFARLEKIVVSEGIRAEEYQAV
ncbi:MAG: ABC transporter permease [Deltaproteobacteria bacterium]|nr:ABC transporter permease [Deltaproteobacteria bacterium]MBW2670426.1 ABC transporter permease [Deltaproteobacteria bacterium]MBW2711939.1 ABC transporter permease [Deltaproteobacteria bacterium]